MSSGHLEKFVLRVFRWAHLLIFGNTSNETQQLGQPQERLAEINSTNTLMRFDKPFSVAEPDLKWEDKDHQVRSSRAKSVVDPWEPVVNAVSSVPSQSTPSTADHQEIDCTVNVINSLGDLHEADGASENALTACLEDGAYDPTDKDSDDDVASNTRDGSQAQDLTFGCDDEAGELLWTDDTDFDHGEPHEAEGALRNSLAAYWRSDRCESAYNDDDEDLTSSREVSSQVTVPTFGFPDDELNASSWDEAFDIDYAQDTDFVDWVALFDYDEGEQQSPWQSEVEEQYDETVQRIFRRANEKATEVVDFINYRNMEERETAFDYLVELFKEHKHYKTYEAILNVAKNGPDLDMLQSVVELRSIWNNQSDRHFSGYISRNDQMFHFPLITWDVSYLICQYRSEYPPELMIEDDWINEWFDKWFSPSIDRNTLDTRLGLINFLVVKVTDIEPAMLATGLRLNYYYDIFFDFDDDNRNKHHRLSNRYDCLGIYSYPCRYDK